MDCFTDLLICGLWVAMVINIVAGVFGVIVTIIDRDSYDR